MSAGTGWSATTPLWYTLQLDNKYLHTGYRKEGSYLKELSMSPQERLRSNLQARRNQGISAVQKTREMAKKVLKERDEYQTKNIKEIGSLVPSWEYQGSLAAVREDLYLTQEDIDEFISLPQSLDKYIAYYKKVWETLQEHNCPHHAVADFSNSNASLSRSFVKSIIPKLQEHFDVKVLMIVRDPIRRLWSEVNSDDQEHFFMRKIQSGDYWNYIEIIEKWERVCPIHVIIMEQLWEGDQQERERQRLSDFLDYDIKKIHENAYCPDRGPDAPHLVGLPDQWTSDKYMLQDELYNKVRPLFPVYQQWVDKYGSLPLYWGKPYNYEV